MKSKKKNAKNNVGVSAFDVIDTKFMYSDHNPVYMNFSLKK